MLTCDVVQTDDINLKTTPLIMKDFQKYMGKDVALIGDGDMLADSLADYLSRHPEIEGKLGQGKKREFMTTDDPEKFKEMGGKFLGRSIDKVKRVSF